MERQHWQDWLVALVGIWLLASNWVLSYAIPATASGTMASFIFWNALLTGAVAIVLAVAALAAFQLWEEWTDIVLGLWLVASPWILGFSDVRLAVWNVVLSGLIILVSAAWAIFDTREAGRA